MCIKNSVFLLLLLAITACSSYSVPTLKHVFYLHGRIVEQQGKHAVSEKYGKYEFDEIVASLQKKNTKLYAEVRSGDVDVNLYSEKISKQINQLIKDGVEPSDITVVGASKGAIIASNISHINKNAVNYVLLAGNNKDIESHYNWQFNGRVLCIYDLSDSIAGRNYNFWKDNNASQFKQLEINTGLGHGFLYKPLKVWLEPTQNWINTHE